MKTVLKKPILTEKTFKLASSLNKYTFAVEANANKNKVAKEVETKFKVKVLNVKIINVLGKVKRFGAARRTIRKQDVKKAIVTLDKKDKIDSFEMK